MRRKEPWVAAVLNFLLPGFGFAYLGYPLLVLGGILFFAVFCWDLVSRGSILWTAITVPLYCTPMAFLGYACAEIVNRSSRDRTDRSYCTSCGAEIERGANYCAKCGKHTG